MEPLIITDEHVCAFYKEHPMLDINSINRACVQLLGPIIGNPDIISTSNFNQQIIRNLADNKKAISVLHET